MMAFRSRHTKTIAVLAWALCAAGAASSWAQDAATVPLNGGKCPTAGAPVVDALSTPHWNGWGVDASQHRFQPTEMAQLAADDVPRLKLKWAFGYPALIIAFAQPTIVAGRLFVGSQSGKVYSLDAGSGCTFWEFFAARPVRSAIVIGQRADGWSTYFGDLGANVYAVDMMTGRELWRTRIDDHPAARVTGSPALVGATLFVPVSSIEEATGFSPLNPTIALLLDNKVGGGRLYAALGYRVEREEELNGAGPRQTVGLRATKPRLCHRL